VIERLFGEGRDLDALQMAVRALVIFGITLALIRVAGMRAFGRKSPFDTIVVITLGAVLSRPIVGVSPFWPCVAAATVLVVAHRVIAIATAKWPALEKLMKGESTVLYRKGVADEHAMLMSGISHADLDEAVRRQVHASRLTDELGVVIETSGELTVVDDPASAGVAARVRSPR
jgi:uncharacterized membrane protein YcaP (DUF421 family)